MPRPYIRPFLAIPLSRTWRNPWSEGSILMICCSANQLGFMSIPSGSTQDDSRYCLTLAKRGERVRSVRRLSQSVAVHICARRRPLADMFEFVAHKGWTRR